MKKLLSVSLFLIPLVFIFVDLKAQTQSDRKGAYNLSEQTYLGGARIYTVNTTDVEGTPLLYDEFKNGRFLFSSSEQSEVVPINYDMEQNEILFKKDGQIMILQKSNIEGFTFELPRDFDSSQDIQEVYTLKLNDEEFGFTEATPVQALYSQNGAVALFALHKVKFVRGNRQDPFSGKITNRYKNETEYFLKTADNEVHKLRRLRAKDIINAIGDDSKKELNRFIKQNDLDEKAEKDLVKLLAYYDNQMADGKD